ncbi:MAG: homoserine dehydrogenase [Planctomycetota bacterium]
MALTQNSKAATNTGSAPASVSRTEKTRVAIVGMGTVGTGVARLLLDHGDRLARHAGRVLWLEKAVVQNLSKDRGIELPTGVLTTDLQSVLDNPEIQVVAHLIGGIEPARTIMLQLLDSGKDVVTSNKALLAQHGEELFDRARSLGRTIAFEASVGGGIPIIANITQCFSANQILSLRGILNGTSNYIITQMSEKGESYATALANSQRLGFAEADPTMDVDGSDATQKLAILAHLAFGVRIPWKEIHRRGLEAFDLDDVRYAFELGYRIRLIATARLLGENLELHVSPTLIRIGRPLAEVRGAYNAISVLGDAVGDMFFHGQGAGQMPTASAVVADMIDTAAGRTDITFRRLELWSDRQCEIELIPYHKTIGRYYMRFVVADEPGVLSKITGILGQYNISISSIIQHEPQEIQEQRQVPLLIMTHECTEGDAAAAHDEIRKLPSVAPCSYKLRVIEGAN